MLLPAFVTTDKSAMPVKTDGFVTADLREGRGMMWGGGGGGVSGGG